MIYARWEQKTYRATGAASTTTTATSATTSTTGSLAAGTLSTLAVGSALSLLTSRGGGSGKLNRDLTLENLLARELSNSALGFGGGRQVDESVTDRAVSSGVLGDRDGLAIGIDMLAVTRHVVPIPGGVDE